MNFEIDSNSFYLIHSSKIKTCWKQSDFSDLQKKALINFKHSVVSCHTAVNFYMFGHPLKVVLHFFVWDFVKDFQTFMRVVHMIPNSLYTSERSSSFMLTQGDIILIPVLLILYLTTDTVKKKLTWISLTSNKKFNKTKQSIALNSNKLSQYS